MFDVAVIGAGPAGAAASIGLARQGYQAALFDAGCPAGVRFERLPPYSIELLKQLGLLAAAEQALVSMPSGSLTRWRHDEEAFTLGPVHILDRNCFDRGLAAIARRHGVSLFPFRASRPVFADGHWTLSAGSTHFEARFLIDASGRSSNQSRNTLPHGPATAALCGVWTGLSFREMRTEASRNSWVWGAPVSGRSAAISIFLPSQRCAGLTSADRHALCLDILQSTRLFRGCLQGKLLSPILVRDATPRADPDPVTIHGLKTGDACLAVDPLLSHGLQIALRLSVHGAAVGHTVLSGAGAPDAAVEFFRASQRATLEQHLAGAARLYAEHSTYAGEPFWMERSRSESPTPPLSSQEATRGGKYRLSPLARVEPVPALLDNGIIDRVEGFRHSSYARPVAFLAGAGAGVLLRALASPAPLAELLRRCEQTVGPVQAPRVIEDLLQHCVLVPLGAAAHAEHPVGDSSVLVRAGDG